ncbi:MAG: 3,4-dehydroadipyl-CoA semialdehyde dehydrogenase [Thermoanaerobaculia bacterium]|nr:3,4-dehydroadipyl-CoA semialdehyde dehydrogenase [Thermoanaerobaculia bacterium]
MKTLTSYLSGRWHAADRDFQILVDPSTEAPLAQASSTGADFAGALEWARRTGGPALRELTFGQRGEILKALSKKLREHRDELLELSRANNGTTGSDGSFDVDGGGGALAVYGNLGLALGDRRVLLDGGGDPLAKSEAFWSQHVQVPKQGVALFVNAFNFPAWGFAEKFACAFLAGMPVIAKPATATALTAHRLVEIVLASGLLPPGALQLVVGSTGDLLDRLGAQDVLAFTGSAETALKLRGKRNLLAASVHVNVEADSLNAAVLGPDATPGSAVFDLFVKDVVREMTQKAGQKCTAVRRVVIPAALEAAVSEVLVARLARTVTGNPADESVRMGPLATADQLRDAVDGIAELLATADLVHGSGQRIDGAGAPAGKGYFVGPTLLRSGVPLELTPVHHREVFAPVATLLPYDGSAPQAAAIVALAQGTLVTSAYSDDADWLRGFLAAGGCSTGRLYVGSTASEGAGSGACFPQSQHGGPGRAGGGAELGGLRGLAPYLQRVALQGHRALVDAVAGA